MQAAEQLVTRRQADSPMLSISDAARLCCCCSHLAWPCSRALSQRVATYNQRLVNEGDTLAEEVKLCSSSSAPALPG